jgi:DNA-binding protein H-NS
VNFRFGKTIEYLQGAGSATTEANAKAPLPTVVERDELQTRMEALAALVGKASNGDGLVARGKTRGRRRGVQSAKAKVHPLKGRKAPPKYQGPNGETWAGRGLTPKWMTALEKKGKKRESFLIQQ